MALKATLDWKDVFFLLLTRLRSLFYQLQQQWRPRVSVGKNKVNRIWICIGAQMPWVNVSKLLTGREKVGLVHSNELKSCVMATGINHTFHIVNYHFKCSSRELLVTRNLLLCLFVANQRQIQQSTRPVPTFIKTADSNNKGKMNHYQICKCSGNIIKIFRAFSESKSQIWKDHRVRPEATRGNTHCRRWWPSRLHRRAGCGRRSKHGYTPC